VLSNLTDCEAAPAICEYFADLMMGLPPAPYHQRFKEASLAFKGEVMPAPLVQPTPVQHVCGRYQHVFLGQAQVSEGTQSGHLHLDFGPKPAHALLVPTGENIFRIEFDDANGGRVGESLWGIAIFKGQTLTLKGFNRFDNETFVFEKIS
jgi:hypothetical protein